MKILKLHDHSTPINHHHRHHHHLQPIFIVQDIFCTNLHMICAQHILFTKIMYIRYEHHKLLLKKSTTKGGPRLSHHVHNFHDLNILTFQNLKMEINILLSYFIRLVLFYRDIFIRY